MNEISNAYDLMRSALTEARRINAAADSNANLMAECLDGRLRHVDGYKLRRLKRQLCDFNIQTRKWKR